MIEVFEVDFFGSKLVFAHQEGKAVADFLRAKGIYDAPAAMDDGYFVDLPDGRRLYQGRPGFRDWIDHQSN